MVKYILKCGSNKGKILDAEKPLIGCNCIRNFAKLTQQDDEM